MRFGDLKPAVLVLLSLACNGCELDDTPIPPEGGYKHEVQPLTDEQRKARMGPVFADGGDSTPQPAQCGAFLYTPPRGFTEQSSGAFPSVFKQDKTFVGPENESQTLTFVKISWQRHGWGPSFEVDFPATFESAFRSLRHRCNRLQLSPGAESKLNGIPAMRFSISGELTERGMTTQLPSREFRATGYLLADDSDVVLLAAWAIGPAANSEISRMQGSLSSLKRHGGPPSADMTGSRAGKGGAQGRGAGSSGGSQPADGRTNGGREGIAGNGTSTGGRAKDDDPEFFQKNLEILQSGDARDSFALQQLAAADPQKCKDEELRKKIAQTIKEIADNGDMHARHQAIPALATWGQQYSVPILLGYLEEDSSFMSPLRGQVIKALGKLADPRAVEPLVMLFINDLSARQDAADALRAIGPAAEDKVLELCRPTDMLITRETVVLLGDIGTEKSIAALKQLRQLRFYMAIQRDVVAATQRIKEREAAGSN